jgi:predicted nuclease with RNAse H fold
MKDPDARVVGIDLTGSEDRPSGWALVQRDTAITGLAYTDAELLEQTIACGPRVVSIDSPLSIPVGRDCTDDACACRAAGGITRHCERELKRRGVNVYPCLIQSMQALTRRGMRIAAELRAAGIDVIESYPGAAQDIMRIPRKRASQERLRAGLVRFGVRGIRRPELVTHDELDAVTSAVVGFFYLADEFEGLGTADEGYLIVPRMTDVLVGSLAPAESDDAVVFVVAGEDSGAVADTIRARDAHMGSSSEACVMAVATADEFKSVVAEVGPRARGFYIAPEHMRLKRRPSLFDDHCRVGRGDVDAALDAWISAWARRQPCH